MVEIWDNNITIDGLEWNQSMRNINWDAFGHVSPNHTGWMSWMLWADGELYAQGTEDRTKDEHILSVAMYCFRLAAEEGRSAAQVRLSSGYLAGDGVELNLARAQYWFDKSQGKQVFDEPPERQRPECAIKKVLNTLLELLGEQVFYDSRRFKAALKDIAIEKEADKIRNLLNIAVGDMDFFGQLKANGGETRFLVPRLTEKMVSDYAIDKNAAKTVMENLSEFAGGLHSGQST